MTNGGGSRGPTVTVARKRTASIAALSDDDHKEFASDYLKYKLQMSPSDQTTHFAIKNTWADIAAFVKMYDSIDKLVMFYHGTPGQIEVNHNFTSLSNSSVLGNFTGTLPTLKEINFEACNVGNRVADLVPFGKALNVSKITAFTFFWVTSNKIVTVEQGNTGNQIAALFADDSGYMLPYNWNEIAQRRGDRKIFLEWFRENYDASNLPAKGPPGSLDTRFKFKKRTSATDETVQASSLTTPSSGAMSAPATTFKRIILTF
jgi:hypothetical protein